MSACHIVKSAVARCSLSTNTRRLLVKVNGLSLSYQRSQSLSYHRSQSLSYQKSVSLSSPGGHMARWRETVGCSRRLYSTEDGDKQPASDEGQTDKKDQVVVVEKLDGLHIMTIGINRPEKRNCVNAETSEQLKLAFQDFNEDENMYCCVLHGFGGNFSAGYDLSELSDMQDDMANKVAEFLMDEGPMGPTRMSISKPVIAAVNGYCVAGGLELALMCDMRVVEDGSKMGVLCRRFGVPLIDGGTVRLSKLIGLSRAMDLILTGRIIEPKEALEFGLANRVVGTGTAYGQAINLAKELVKFPQECLRVDRRSAMHSAYSDRSIEDSLQWESDNAAHVLTTESIEGAKKFVAGLGRSGKFNVSEASERQGWQKEFEEMKKVKKEKKDKKDDDDD